MGAEQAEKSTVLMIKKQNQKSELLPKHPPISQLLSSSFDLLTSTSSTKGKYQVLVGFLTLILCEQELATLKELKYNSLAP